MMMRWRVLWNIVVFILLFIAPFWLTFLAAFAGLVFFPRYIEFVFIALCAEFLYRGQDYHFFGIMLPLIAIAFGLFIITETLRMYVRRR